MVSRGDFAAAAPASKRAGWRLSVRLTAFAAAAMLACAAGAALAAVAPVGPTLREGVAAIVNDEVISTYDLRQRTLLLIVTSGVQVDQSSLPQIEREALRQLVARHSDASRSVAMGRRRDASGVPSVNDRTRPSVP